MHNNGHTIEINFHRLKKCLKRLHKSHKHIEKKVHILWLCRLLFKPNTNCTQCTRSSYWNCNYITNPCKQSSLYSLQILICVLTAELFLIQVFDESVCNSFYQCYYAIVTPSLERADTFSLWTWFRLQNYLESAYGQVYGHKRMYPTLKLCRFG